jgi:hypothetical protein
MMLLHRSFLQGGLISASRNVSNRSAEEEEALSQCSKTASTLIKAAPRIAGSLPASPFLLGERSHTYLTSLRSSPSTSLPEYAQQLLVAGGYLALNAWRYRGTGAADQHLAEASEACLALHGLEPIFPSARALRRVLDSVIRKLKIKLNPQLAAELHRAGHKSSYANKDAFVPHHDASQSQASGQTQAPASADPSAPFDSETWMNVLNSSATDFATPLPAMGNPGEGMDVAHVPVTPSHTSIDMPNPFGGLDFQGLEWLESLLGNGTETASEASNQDNFSALLWE